ncbi:MAG: sugar transferase [Phenylobacterium sp.]
MSTQETFATYDTGADKPVVTPPALSAKVMPLIRLPAADFTASYSVKRAIDFLIAAVALVFLAPLMLLLWAVVASTSEGPGLFWSRRVGRDGKVFWMPKYRTMTHGAPLSPREVLAKAEDHITPVGALLRRSALDELPQLLCVLRGDMSIIGPRPLLPEDPGVRARRQFPCAMRARPGLSGLAQVVGRNSVSPRRKARLDALYAQSTSLGLDLLIFWRTAGIVLTSRGFI